MRRTYEKLTVVVASLFFVAAFAATGCGNGGGEEDKDTGGTDGGVTDADGGTTDGDGGTTDADGGTGGMDADTGGTGGMDADGGTGGTDADGGTGGMDADTGPTGGMDTDGGSGTGDADTGGGGDTTDTAPDGSKTPQFQEVSCSSVSASANVQVGPGTQFQPSTGVTINKGQVVKWTWASTVSLNHNVTADDDSACAGTKPSWFQSSTTAASGNTFCVRFQTKGTWNYQCTVSGHCMAGMKGEITVQ